MVSSRFLNRVVLIQDLFKQTNFSKYLEIGSFVGKSLLPFPCKEKVAIDPNFKIPLSQKLKYILKYPSNLNNRYFNMTSDAFFLNEKKFLVKFSPVDVIFIDGLHTFEASLRDALNCISCLSVKGVLIMHDCFPISEASAMPTKGYPTKEERNVEGWDGSWSGDVWKTIVYLKKHFSDVLDISVIDVDHGLGIIRKKENFMGIDTSILRPSFDEINKLLYQDMVLTKFDYLNLKPRDYAYELVDIIAKNG